MAMRLLILGLLLCVAWAAPAAVWEDREWRLAYKTCGAYGEVEEAVLEESVMSMDIVRNGYYRGKSQSVEMMGQCEADLDACECLQCLTHALHYCPASLSAEIRLDKCFIAYLYHPGSFLPGGLNNNSSSNITRTAAIVVGAVVALLLALLFLSFLRSRYYKHHYYY